MSTTTKETRLPELHLPEITREGIARGLSEIHVPDLSKIERPNIEMPDIDLSAIDLRRRNVGKAVTSAAQSLGLVRQRRSRWPFVVAAAIVAGLTAWALMHSTTFRDRLDRAARMARVRIDEMQQAHEDLDDVAGTAPHLVNGSADIAGALDAADATANDYPKGLAETTDLMAAAGEGIPAFEAAKARN